MAKKKTTMTLRDFHGGSIPSDHPLPSAPGFSLPPDRSTSWGSAAIAVAGARPGDQNLLRPRPGSSSGAGGGGGRGLDERPTVFLSQPTLIGRHFDEDERKPFDTSSAPRRAPAVEPGRPPPPVVAAVVSDRSSVDRPVSVPQTVRGFSRTSENPRVVPNAWGVRKEAMSEPLPRPEVPVAAVDLVRLVQTSAVDKVLSGRWQSKPSNVEVIRFEEVEALEQRFGETVRVADVGDGRVFEPVRPRSGPAITDGGDKESSLQGFYSYKPGDQERGMYGMYQEAQERKSAAVSYTGGIRPTSAEAKFNVSKMQQHGVAEVLERPKLNLLPRTKQLDSLYTRGGGSEDKQVNQQPVGLVQVHTVHDVHGNANTSKLAEDEGSPTIERPKLNLKPRTQIVEQPDIVNEKERKTVFAGARPRELVLKERGIDVANEPDFIVQPSKNDLSESESKLEPPMANQPGEWVGFLVGQKTGSDLDKRSQRPDAEKDDASTASWRNDNWKNTINTEKPPQQRSDRDTWRKPLEQPKPEHSGSYVGKIASPLELAQAFSPSASESKSGNHIAYERSLSGQSPVPFSRLTDNREFHSQSALWKTNGSK